MECGEREDNRRSDGVEVALENGKRYLAAGANNKIRSREGRSDPTTRVLLEWK